jgi:hypothetical protein
MVKKIVILVLQVHILVGGDCEQSFLALFAHPHPVRRNSVPKNSVSDEEHEKKAAEHALLEKNKGDLEFFQQLYGIVYACYQRKDKLCSKASKEMQRAIATSPAVLQSRSLLQYDPDQPAQEIEPLLAFAHLVCGSDRWWSGGDRAETYKTLFLKTLEIDNNNMHRIKALGLFIQRNKIDLVQEMLKRGTTITVSIDPVMALISRCHAKKKRENTWAMSICTLLQRAFQNWFIEDAYHYEDEINHRDDALQDSSKKYDTQSHDAQLDALAIAHVLIEAQANVNVLAGGYDFPPEGHRKACLSCCFLYRRYREGNQKKTV